MCFAEQGADMNAVNSWGATPLHEAIDRGDAEVNKFPCFNLFNFHTILNK